MIKTTDILSALSDDKALILFNAISLGKCSDCETLRKSSGITQSQDYSRLRRITNMGLVKRENGKYITTVLGSVVYEIISIIDKTLNHYWALIAIESLRTSSTAATKEDKLMLMSMLIDILIDDNQLKRILTNTPILLAS